MCRSHRLSWCYSCRHRWQLWFSSLGVKLSLCPFWLQMLKLYLNNWRLEGGQGAGPGHHGQWDRRIWIAHAKYCWFWHLSVEIQEDSSILPYTVKIERNSKLSRDKQAQINLFCTCPIIVSPCQQLAKYVWDDSTTLSQRIILQFFKLCSEGWWDRRSSEQCYIKKTTDFAEGGMGRGGSAERNQRFSFNVQ